MSNPSNANDGKRMARRRLLRGAYAVPAVLTVHTGSALAATSSPLACFGRLPTSVSVGGPDSFWRVQQYTTGGGNKVVKVSEIVQLCTDKAGVGTIDTTFLTGKNWLKVSDSSSVNPSSTNPDPAGFQVAVKFDIKTATPLVWKVTGVSSTVTGKPMAQSCWNSFVVG